MLEKDKAFEFLDYLFKPKNIAIFGASNKTKHFIGGFEVQGFDKNKIYLINPTKDELFGYRVYKSLKEIPVDTIDHLILTVGREKLVPSLIEIFSQKKVNIIHIFTAGTGESDEEGVKIEREIKRLLNNNKINTRIIGPNCMGVYNPKGHIAYLKTFPQEPGNIGLIFQSGDLHTRLIKFGDLKYMLRFSKGVSIGNTIDLQISEILQYLDKDADTDIICIYFEGFSSFHPNEGRNLLNILKTIKKPILFMRGGETNRGQAAVVTHTGTIGTNQRIWDAVYKQTTIIKVPTSLESMLDYLYMFYAYINKQKRVGVDISHIQYPEGKNALVILWSGGFGILATDTLTKLGFNMPVFKGETLEKLRNIYPIKIGSLSNPLDLPWIENTKEYLEICKSAISENIDLTIIETDAPSNLESENFHAYFANLKQIKDYVEALNKVLILILYQYPSQSRNEYYDLLIKEGFIVYSTLQRAAQAFLALYEYGQKIKEFKYR